jgi:hypothetical protein
MRIGRENIVVFMDLDVRIAVDLHYANAGELLGTKRVARNLLSGE